MLHSKIKTGGLPDFDELVRKIGSQLEGSEMVSK